MDEEQQDGEVVTSIEVVEEMEIIVEETVTEEGDGNDLNNDVKGSDDVGDDVDIFDETPVKSKSKSSSKSPVISISKVDENFEDEDSSEDDEDSPPPTPRVRHKRECVEAAKKRLRVDGKPEEEDAKKPKTEPQESRECSCERSDCSVSKSCCLAVVSGCLGISDDAEGKLYQHLSKSEHVCHVCYDVLWKPNQKLGQKFAGWKTAWMDESRCNPSVKAFIMDQMLPYFVECFTCGNYRAVPSETVLSSSEISEFECQDCDQPEDPRIPEVKEFSWILTIAKSPLLQNSPCLHYLRGGHYFYDELGLSPVECKYEEQKDCLTADFMSPFNIPDQQSKAFCLRPDVMEYDEVLAFPEYGLEPIVYLAIRNLLVTLWNLNPFKYLTLEDCIPHVICRGLVRVWMIQEINRILNYLCMKSIVNYGILNFPKKSLMGNEKPLEVIIIGAGISGLSAARQLRSFGANVKVLEAKGHIGGRMQDDWSLGVAVGCGAQLVTGSINNPIILMCRQLDVKYRIVTGSCPMIDGEVGGVIDPKVDRYVEEHFDCILDALFTWKNNSHGADASLEDQINLVHKTLLDSSGVKWEDVEERVLQFHLGNIEFSCGTKMNDVSWRHWDQNEAVALFAGSHALLTEGSSEIIKKLAEGTDVRTHHEVQRIDWNANRKKMVVHCENDKKFSADKVLVATPLSVLQKGLIEFCPQLPTKKTEALENVGAGLIEKVAVRFPRKFWSSATKDGELNYFSLVPKKGMDRGLFNMFYDFSTRNTGSKHQNYVLMSYVCGNSVEMVNDLSDVEVVKAFVDTLRDMFPNEDIPDPTGHVVTHWGRDPHIGMSYSYVRVNGQGEHYDWLAQSVNKKLYFAGEHTNRFFPQTMTGAYLSGLREAGKMVEDYCKMP